MQFDRNQINSQVQKVLVVEEKGREAEEEEDDDGEEEDFLFPDDRTE